MPYSGPDDSSLPQHVQDLPADKRAQWVEVWNSAYEDCDGGTEECEEEAFRIANGTVKAHAYSSQGTMIAMEFRAVEGLPEWIPLMPKPGEYYHDYYGYIIVTTDRNQRFVDNVNEGVYQESLPIDAEHMYDTSGALGWIVEARLNADGSVDGKVEWTDRGERLVTEDRFRYVSPSFFDVWIDPVTEEEVYDVLNGAALTTKPFFKEDALRSLVANERGLWVVERIGSVERRKQFRETGSTREDPSVKQLHEMSVDEIRALERKPLWQMLIKRDFNELSDAQAEAVEEVLAAEPAEDPEDDPTDDLQAQLDAITQERDSLQSRLDELEADPADPEAEPVEMRQMRETISTQTTELNEYKGRVARLEDSLRRQRFNELAADWIGETKAHVDFLCDLADKFGEDSKQFKHYMAREQASAQQAKQLTETLGSDREPEEHSPEGRLNLAVKQYREAHPEVTEAEATRKVLDAQPDLYEAYVTA